MTWLKEKLKAWLFPEEEESIAYAEMQKISIGKTPEEKLAFWLAMQGWLEKEEGRAFMAIMHREYERLHMQLLTDPDKTKLPEVAAQMRQQNFVISLPVEITNKIATHTKRVAEKNAPGLTGGLFRGAEHARRN